MLDVEVISEPDAAAAALDPIRRRILATLGEPGSASSVAVTLGIPRQLVNYHLRTLEGFGLVHFVEGRPRRGMTERVVEATAKTYIVSPTALSEAAAEPGPADRLSSRYLIALAARMLREVSDLARKAADSGKPLATLAIDTEIRFASAADRAAFSSELANVVTVLAAKYHDEQAKGGRWHRLIVGAHPHSPQAHSTRGPHHG